MAIRLPYIAQRKITKKSGISPTIGGQRKNAYQQRSLNKPYTGSEWDNIQQFSDKITNIGEKIRVAEIKERENDYINSLNNRITNFQDDLRNNPEWNDRTTDEHEEAVLNFYEQEKNIIDENIRDKESRQALEKHLNTKYLNVRSNARSWGWKRQITRGKNKTLRNIDENLEAFKNTGNAEIFSDIALSIDNAVQAGYYSEEEGAELKVKTLKKASYNHFAYQIAMDHENILKGIKPVSYKYIQDDPNGLKKNLNEYDIQELENKALTLQSKWEREQARLNKVDMTKDKEFISDYLSKVEYTGEDNPALYHKFKDKYGEDFANKFKEKEKQADWKYNTRTNIYKSTPEDLANLINTYDPNNFEGVEGFNNRIKDFQYIYKTINERNQELTSDPYGYVQRYFGEDDPMLRDNDISSISANIATQKYLGITNPSVMTSMQAKQISEQIKTIEPDEAVNMMEGLKQTYGKYYEIAFNDLAKNDLPTSYQIPLSLTENEVTTNEKSRFIESVRINEKTLRDTIEDYNTLKDDLRLELNDELDEYKTSLPNTQAGIEYFRSVRNSLEKYVLYQISQGVNENDAIESALKFLNVRYSYLNQDNTDKKIRIPKEVINTTPDIKDRLDKIKQDFDVNTIDKNIYSEYGEEVVKDKSDWYFQVDDDKKGATLYHQENVPVISNGKPVTYSWEEIQNKNVIVIDEARKREDMLREIAPGLSSKKNNKANPINKKQKKELVQRALDFGD